jgi:hypothetical protein
MRNQEVTMAAAKRRQAVGLAAVANLPGLDPAQREFLKQRLLSEQNLPMAVVVGSAAALLGAAGWATATVMTGYKLGIIAIAVGLLVGMAVRSAGRGVTPVFAVVGGLLAMVSCGAGNLLAVTTLAARHAGLPLATALGRLDFERSRELLVGFSSPKDVLFYGIAIYEGFRFAIRPLGRAQLQAMLSGPSAPTP